MTFNEIGIHTLKLIVRDAYGKIAEIEKDIEVTSTLRPELFVSPVAGVR